MARIGPISRQIWDMKYRLKQPGGAPVDKSIEDSWRRVARALAAVEAEPAAWEDRFAAALDDFAFLPAGRILAGAGTTRKVTLFNCFVMGEIPDDMTGIFDHLKEAALTMQQGGGIGYDFSTLRPRGAEVKGVGADASGPLSFMDVWDAMCRTIMSAGHRRGAMMATLRCDHPDIEAFVDAKEAPGRLRMFNLSVLVTDAFMTAVADDAPWDLVFGGETVRTVQARDLWDRIMRATYAYAEPGVIFIDRINDQNNLAYCETISATNPCVTADTWVQTGDGPRLVADLIGRPFAALVDGEAHVTDSDGFFQTGRRPVLLLETVAGHRLRLTVDHPVRRVVARTRYRHETEWCHAGDLAPGDEVKLHDHRAAPAWPGPYTADEGYLIGLLVGDGTLKTDKAVLSAWPGPYTADEGYLIGLLVGDGTLKTDKAVLSAWPGEAVANGDTARPGVAAVMARALAAAKTLNHCADFRGWMTVPGRGEHRMALGAVKPLAAELGLVPGAKSVTPAIESASSAFCRGFLQGLFDADSCVQGDQRKGVSVRLAQSDLGVLRAVQRMLLRLGIAARIYAERRPAGPRRLPDGKGGTAVYDCAADHELVVAGENLARFDELVGFADTEKAARLDRHLRGYRRTLNRERFVATVSRIAPDGVAEVFDVRVPGVKAFDANGLVVHNCGEQPLPPYGACLLGSINLARLVSEPFGEAAALDTARLEELVPVAVRMMDNVIDVSGFPLEAQAQEARAKRRIGLGVTGLADALIMCGARYGSDAAVALAKRWMAAVTRAAYLASADLAREKGAFPLFDKDAYLARPFIQALDDDVQAAIAAHGIRNALITSVAPTGTISLFADNVSSGIEPVFSFTYTRNVLMPEGDRRAEEVTDYAYREFRRRFGDEAPLTDAFVDAQSLSPHDHVVMQAALQAHVDSSISKTINCPEDVSFEAFKDIYREAYDLGCKGCTTYRPNPVTGAVLEAPRGEAEAPEGEPEPAEGTATRPRDVFEAGGVVYMTQPLDRPEELAGKTYKLRWPDSEHAIYITVNDVIRDGRRRPFEVFINSKNMEHYAWTVALTRMISAVFRRGGDVSFVVEELKAVFDPRGGQWVGGHYVPSLLAAIGEVIERHMTDIGFLPVASEGGPPEVDAQRAVVGDPEAPGGLAQCPICGSLALIQAEGCDLCTACGYSRCG